MIIDTPARHIYTGNGNQRVFPIPTKIIGDDYIRIEIDSIYQSDRTKWDIVNNSVIFITAPLNGTTIDIQVATSEEALSVLGSSTSMDIVAESITNVNTVATNIVDINQIVDNLPKILLADDNATTATQQATIATTKASEASASANQALTSRNQAETFKNSASTSATTATTKASEASVSATSASTSANQALTSRNQAETFAQQAEASAKLVNSIAELKLIGGSTVNKLEVLGYYTKGDGGDGTFYWDSTSTEADNGGTIIQATGITTGRWKRVYSGAVNVKWFGAKGDGIADDSVAIQQAFNNATTSMIIDGTYYTKKILKFNRYVNNNTEIEIISNCTIYANLDDATPDISFNGILSKAAIHVGDDSANGIYPLKITGFMNIVNIGTARAIDTHGVVVQSAAYGSYNITGISGFDIGLFIKGVIFSTFDAKRGTYSNNNLDIMIQLNQSEQGVLRHTNNLTTFKQIKLSSAYKIKAEPVDVNIVGLPYTGGNIQFYDILCEGHNYSSVTKYHAEAMLQFTEMSEAMPSGRVVKINNMWIEEVASNVMPLLKTNSTVIFDNLFIAANYNTPAFVQTASTEYLVFKNSSIYFGDGEPTYLFDAPRLSNIIWNTSSAYGINDGSAPFIFLQSFIGNFIIKSFDFSSDNFKIAEVSLSNSYSGATNSYMSNAVVNMENFVKSLFGDNPISVQVEVVGSDGGQPSIGIYKGVGRDGRLTFSTVIANPNITQSGDTLTFPTGTVGSLYDTRFTVTAYFRNNFINSYT